MQNLEQRRAANALQKSDDCRKKDDEGDCLSGYPALIINNGLLACLAYSLEKKGQHERIAKAIAFHLDDMGICERIGGGTPDAGWLLGCLAGRNRAAANAATAFTLRRATDEALAFLGYLKRFAKQPSTPLAP